MDQAVYNNINFEDSCACPVTWIGPQLGGTCFGQTYLFMMILRNFIQARCDLVDPCNRFKPDRVPDDTYDFVVIGGGTAGSVVAGRLAENPAWKVLVLEAGGDEPPLSAVPAMLTAYWWNNETDWLYYTEPQEKACLSEPDRKCYWPRARLLGGTATFNGMMYTRGHAADYDGWAVNGAKGWSWQDVFPYFLMSEDNQQIGTRVSRQWHNKGGPMPVQQFPYAPALAHDVIAASIEMGFPPTTDLNGDNVTGFTIAQTFNKNGSRYTTSRAYLRPKSSQKNLHVVFQAHVSKILIDPVLKKVTGVEYIDRRTGEKKQVKVKREAILSGGTMNSPHILMLSGIGPKETLDKFNIPTISNLPGVGQNLHNHVGVDIKFLLTKIKDIPELNFGTAVDYLLKRQGPLASTNMAQVTGMGNSKYAPAGGRQPDMQFFFRGYESACGDGAFPDPETIDKSREVGISAINLQPKSRGYLTIRSVDPFDKPVFQPNYLYDDQDVKVLIEAAKISYALANSTLLRNKYGMIPLPGYAEKECGVADPNNEEFLRCLIQHYTAPENHQVGTCKIGAPTDLMAVVDPELKVYGVDGLRVIDASVMPVVNTANTMAPVIMIAERGARFIMNKYQLHNKNRPDFDLGNRFGDSSASIENGDKWNFSPDSNQRDDKLTETNRNQWNTDSGQQEGDSAKPWSNWHQWHGKPWGNHHWEHKNSQFQHDPEWHRKHDGHSSRY